MAALTGGMLVVHITNRKNAPLLFFHTNRDATTYAPSRRTHARASHTCSSGPRVLFPERMDPDPDLGIAFPSPRGGDAETGPRPEEGRRGEDHPRQAAKPQTSLADRCSTRDAFSVAAQCPHRFSSGHPSRCTRSVSAKWCGVGPPRHEHARAKPVRAPTPSLLSFATSPRARELRWE